jgi:hypothetical protein
MYARRFFLPDYPFIILYLHNCTFGSVVYSRGSSTIHNLYYLLTFLCPNCSVIFISIIFFTVFLLSVNLLLLGVKFNVLFVLRIFKTRGLWPLHVATRGCNSGISDFQKFRVFPSPEIPEFRDLVLGIMRLLFLDIRTMSHHPNFQWLQNLNSHYLPEIKSPVWVHFR